MLGRKTTSASGDDTELATTSLAGRPRHATDADATCFPRSTRSNASRSVTGYARTPLIVPWDIESSREVLAWFDSTTPQDAEGLLGLIQDLRADPMEVGVQHGRSPLARRAVIDDTWEMLFFVGTPIRVVRLQTIRKRSAVPRDR